MKRPIAQRILGSAMAFVLAFLGTAPQTFAATSDKKAKYLESGVYRIKNQDTGLYVDAYDVAYDKKGSAYLSKESGESGQDFYVQRQPDGTYFLYPQSEDGKYALSSSSGDVVTKNSEAGKTEKFDIYPSGKTYTICPAYSGEKALALDVSDKTSRYDDTYVSMNKYHANDKGQKWIFETVLSTGLTMAYEKTTVKLYSTGNFYATVAPYNYGEHEIKWASADSSILLVSESGRYCALSEGSTLVTATCGEMIASCTVIVSNVSAFTWYSQHNIYTSDWDGSELGNIYFSSGGVRRKFAIDKYNTGSDWINDGCYLCSVAMVLKNMGATMTSGYDFRSGQRNNLMPDPYTVALANSGNYGPTTSKAVLYGNPILVSLSNILKRFTVRGKAITSTTTGRVTAKAIKEALDMHPEGVIVYFSQPSRGRTHYIVFTRCINPEEKNPSKYRFEVSDSASYDPERGDHVPFEQCISYTAQGYRLSQARSIIAFNS